MASPLCKTGRVVGQMFARAGSPAPRPGSPALGPLLAARAGSPASRPGSPASRAGSPACQGGHQGEGGRGAGGAGGAGLGLGLLGAGVIALATPFADEKKSHEAGGIALVTPHLSHEKKIFGKGQEADRIRQYSTADDVFDHFASYQLVSDTGKKTNLMSTRNFYNAMTPGSHLGAEMMLGKSAHKQIKDSELNSNSVKTANMMPCGHGGNLLNTINEHGLLTYTDYHFLLLLMSTPTRYLDIMFHGFDVSTDGAVEAKEFVHFLARVSNVKTDPDELMKVASKSGLIRYLFKDDLSGELTKEDFIKLQSDLITDVLEMEFTRYASDIQHNMSETDFCRHLLYSSSVSPKKKGKMIKMVEHEFSGKSKGISFDSFRTFYNVLFGGADLERAMLFLDSDNKGVTKDEFAKIAGSEVDPHVIDVVYCLLDEDEDSKLSTKEFHPVLFSWRHSRGFQHGGLSVTLGNMKF